MNQKKKSTSQQKMCYLNDIAFIFDQSAKSWVSVQSNWTAFNKATQEKKITTNSKPYPSPVNAQHPWICHLCFFIEVRFNNREISAALIEPFTSCLLAYISTAARDNSSWANILYSSSRVMLRRSRSVESITKMTNWKSHYSCEYYTC